MILYIEILSSANEDYLILSHLMLCFQFLCFFPPGLILHIVLSRLLIFPSEVSVQILCFSPPEILCGFLSFKKIYIPLLPCVHVFLYLLEHYVAFIIAIQCLYIGNSTISVISGSVSIDCIFF